MTATLPSSLASASAMPVDLPGDPHGIRESATAYLAFSEAAMAAAVRIEAVDVAGWRGAEARMFTASSAVIPQVLRATSAAFAEVASALTRFADTLEQAQQVIRRLGALHASTSVRLRAVNADLLDARRLDPGAAGVIAPLSAQAHVLRADMSGLATRAVAVREQVEAAARICGSAIDATGSPPVPFAGAAPVYGGGVVVPQPPAPVAEMSQAAIRSWWNGLSPRQQQAAGAEDPLLYGNLPGIPAADRHWINRITLDAELRAGEAMFVEAGLEVPTSVADVEALDDEALAALGVLTPVDHPHGERSYRTNTAAESALERYAGALAVNAQVSPQAATDEPAMVYGYEPGAFEGRGRTLLSWGDPETADNVAVIVPGLTSRTATIDGGNARNLHRQADEEDGRDETAVLYWQGYDAPQLWFSSTTTARDGTAVAFQSKAEAGGRLLAEDVGDLRRARGSRSRPAVIGHSYGSTTTGRALHHHGLAEHVRHVALIGSPGVGGDAKTAADLGLRRDQLLVGSASRDKVTTLAGAHGTDPAREEVGGTRIRAEAVDRGDTFIGDHNAYFATEGDRPSESLAALGLIAADRTDELGARDLLARPRYVETVQTESGPVRVTIDPELGRVPSTGP